MWRTFLCALAALALALQYAQADESEKTLPTTFAGHTVGTALLTQGNATTCNALAVAYTLSGRVVLSIVGTSIEATLKDLVATPPAGFTNPAGYSLPTAPFTIGQFGTAVRFTNNWFSGEANIPSIKSLIPGAEGTDAAVRFSGITEKNKIHGAMRAIALANPGSCPQVTDEMITTFTAVAVDD